MPDLLDADRKKALVDSLAAHQRKDGGWSIRSFARPEERDKGNRAERLRGEPDFADVHLGKPR
jgi:hypothetical protein